MGGRFLSASHPSSVSQTNRIMLPLCVRRRVRFVVRRNPRDELHHEGLAERSVFPTTAVV
ncbi:hypothetical protein Srut_39620 [Streptomyces rutgersensis]|nr:hypothetical protein Srut_39620 [Streptomyces rutgersensis]